MVINPVAAIAKMSQRDEIYQEAGVKENSLTTTRTITNRLDETSQYTAQDLEKLLDNRTNNNPAKGFDLATWLKENMTIVAVSVLGLFAILQFSAKKKR